SPEGKASVFYATKQEHVLCVAVGPDGQVYAGSDKNGLVYRIDAKGKGFVLYQAAQTEVRSIHVTRDSVYGGTSAPAGGRRRGGWAAPRRVVQLGPVGQHLVAQLETVCHPGVAQQGQRRPVERHAGSDHPAGIEG